jgi:hypothetical protein
MAGSLNLYPMGVAAACLAWNAGLKVGARNGLRPWPAPQISNLSYCFDSRNRSFFYRDFNNTNLQGGKDTTGAIA